MRGLSQNHLQSQSQKICTFLQKTITFFIFCFFSFTAFSAFSQQDGDWKLFKESDGIKIFTKKAECHDNVNGLHYEYVFLKIQNTTGSDKKVILTPSLSYDGKKYPVAADNTQNNSILVKAGNEVQGDCSATANESLRLFSRFLNYTNKPSLTAFELNTKVENIQSDE